MLLVSAFLCFTKECSLDKIMQRHEPNEFTNVSFYGTQKFPSMVRTITMWKQ